MLRGGWEAGISPSESEMALFVGDLIGEIAGVWLSLISARMVATRSLLGVDIGF